MSLLEVSKITRHFGGIAAVNDVSFKVNKGDILGLIGPNGAGKSTTFNLISGFYSLSSGSVHYDKKDISNRSPQYLNNIGIARTFQHNVLFSEMTVYENIYLGTILKKIEKSEKNKIVNEILELMNLTEVKDELTENLPHGTQRMVGIAIALATQPELILLDEPLTGMNHIETQEAVDILKKIRSEQETTILIVEHNIKAIMELCNYIVVLNYGEKLAEGTPEEVSKNEKVIQAYLGGE